MGRINGPEGRRTGPEEKVPAAEGGSVTAFPQAEQKRASPDSDAPQPAQYRAIRYLQGAIAMNDLSSAVKGFEAFPPGCYVPSRGGKRAEICFLQVYTSGGNALEHLHFYSVLASVAKCGFS
jgi:hypothetical protein